jgi:hypothetical protein
MILMFFVNLKFNYLKILKKCVILMKKLKKLIKINDFLKIFWFKNKKTIKF